MEPQRGLERLTPKAIRVIEEQLNAGGKDAWRPALRLLEYSWGRPPEYVIPELPPVVDEDDIRKMPTQQLLALVRESRAEGPAVGSIRRGYPGGC